jgi:hypothetical protein
MAVVIIMSRYAPVEKLKSRKVKKLKERKV